MKPQLTERLPDGRQAVNVSCMAEITLDIKDVKGALGQVIKMVKILIVDDEMDFCEYLGRILSREGYNVITATSGKEAIDKVLTEKPHLILLDFLMPQLDGLETLKKIKELDKEAVVMMISAVRDVEMAQKAIRRGAINYITKPLDLDLFKRNIKNWAIWKETNTLNGDIDMITLNYDEESFRTILRIFTNKGYQIKYIENNNEQNLVNGPLDLLILRLDTLKDEALEILSKYKQAYPKLKCMIALDSDSANQCRSKIERLGCCYNIPSYFGIYGLILVTYRILSHTQEKKKIEETQKLSDYILIVDDERDICAYIEKFLSREGYKVCSLTNSKEVLDKVKILKPSTVLLDIIMPEVDGLELLKKIKKINPKIQVIMMTGVKDECVWKESIECGAVDYLIKPFSLDQLKATIFTNNIKYHLN